VGVPKEEEKIQQQQQRDQASACRIAEESGTTANRSSLSLSLLSFFLFVCCVADELVVEGKKNHLGFYGIHISVW